MFSMRADFNTDRWLRIPQESLWPIGHRQEPTKQGVTGNEGLFVETAINEIKGRSFTGAYSVVNKINTGCTYLGRQ